MVAGPCGLQQIHKPPQALKTGFSMGTFKVVFKVVWIFFTLDRKQNQPPSPAKPQTHVSFKSDKPSHPGSTGPAHMLQSDSRPGVSCLMEEAIFHPRRPPQRSELVPALNAVVNGLGKV